MKERYTVEYILRQNEANVLRSILLEQRRTFNSFKEAVDFVRALKQNERVVGQPVIGV